ncbi:MAG TPA: M20/M25/M40 family metallo-hydrolase [Firmicutes bacterium]|nr:M20/M25/M40 family metallo-hydrolase [Bacillota bacterium]
MLYVECDNTVKNTLKKAVSIMGLLPLPPEEDFRPCLCFAAELIRTRSLPGEEGPVAALCEAQMRQLGYDRVWIDEVGNVLGLIYGKNRHRTLAFNSHMDHVAAGEESRWPHPPYAGVIEGGRLWGRGASDVKGALAVQLYAAALYKKRYGLPPCNVLMCCVVMEETGGVGSRHLAETVSSDLVILGEATKNELRVGHRGRYGFIAEFTGVSCHASQAWRGANPHHLLGPFLCRLAELPPTRHPVLGESSAVPTTVWTDQTSTNVVPGMIGLTIDYRSLPQESAEMVRERLVALMAEVMAALKRPDGGVAGLAGKISFPQETGRTWNGRGVSWIPAAPAYYLEAEAPLVKKLQQLLAPQAGPEVPVGIWHFATDGGYLAAKGIPVVGYAPGEEHLAHTVEDSISLDLMRESLAGHMTIIKEAEALFSLLK